VRDFVRANEESWWRSGEQQWAKSERLLPWQRAPWDVNTQTCLSASRLHTRHTPKATTEGTEKTKKTGRGGVGATKAHDDGACGLCITLENSVCRQQSHAFITIIILTLNYERDTRLGLCLCVVSVASTLLRLVSRARIFERHTQATALAPAHASTHTPAHALHTAALKAASQVAGDHLGDAVGAGRPGDGVGSSRGTAATELVHSRVERLLNTHHNHQQHRSSTAAAARFQKDSRPGYRPQRSKRVRVRTYTFLWKADCKTLSLKSTLLGLTPTRCSRSHSHSLFTHIHTHTHAHSHSLTHTHTHTHTHSRSLTHTHSLTHSHSTAFFG
jgi:hypothetical protein